MKKILVASLVLLGASYAFAEGAAVCTNQTTAKDGTKIDSNTGKSGSSGSFVVNEFTPKCSAKVHAAFEQNSTVAGVAAGSSAGSKLFTGSTNGGSVAPTSDSYSTGVTDTAVKSATAALLTAGSGSGS